MRSMHAWDYMLTLPLTLRKGCELLSLVLEQLGVPAASLHSGKPQKQRIAALAAFKSEMVPLLLATDVASRGLDIPTVDLVVNFDLPILARCDLPTFVSFSPFISCYINDWG